MKDVFILGAGFSHDVNSSYPLLTGSKENQTKGLGQALSNCISFLGRREHVRGIRYSRFDT